MTLLDRIDYFSVHRVFSRWEDYVSCFAKTQQGGGSGLYEQEPDASILQKAQEHRDHHERSIGDKEDVFVLVHPFFATQVHQETFTSQQQETHKQYLRNLEFLIDKQKTIIVLDSAFHYATATSKLLEQGRINTVYFTQAKRGLLRDPQRVQRFRGRVFFGGCYSGICLSHAIKQHIGLDFYVLQDLSLAHPKHSPDLQTRNVSSGIRQELLVPNNRFVQLSGAFSF